MVVAWFRRLSQVSNIITIVDGDGYQTRRRVVFVGTKRKKTIPKYGTKNIEVQKKNTLMQFGTRYP